MKKLFTLALLGLLGLSACQKSSYPYFAKSTAPSFERKKVNLSSPVQNSVSIADTNLHSSALTASLVEGPSLPGRTFEEKLVPASSYLQTKHQQNFKHKFVTKLVAKKVAKMQAKAQRTAERKTDPIATLATIAGLIALFDLIAFHTGILFLVGMLLAIIGGFVALSKINRRPREFEGRGLAIAGLVLGFLELLVFIIILINVAANSSY
ncbi:hypothetical protein BWI96_03230 [Siphonobacter sp. SORGH_AS_0500]|uniref:DUF4190 domain-containing protein n=1 Tax=Siphonobacter sp. SORGH_AS_0500 TaxID=1864824 RepID=UPI000CB4FF5C|nr:DUF4190 domain-containing protein [Siphonobacter sp. SORGH_AS_0500]PKK38102.1 hypothetical protein BWI96_03230 [Siphonobacter sp. SORGH_AS_0500]